MKTTLLRTALAAFAFVASGLHSTEASAKVNVITTLTDLRAITSEVGKDLVNVESIAKGTQDPHYIEAKPSFMVKVGRADLVVSIGLDLEIGWLPSIIQGARNPKVVRGQKGFLEVGPLVEPLEVHRGDVSRSEGDVHPFGNPHVTLDPVRSGEIAGVIASRLGEIDAEHAAQYSQNAKAFQERMKRETQAWASRIQKSGVKAAVTYHKTLTYFLDRFKVENPAILEPKPGIPPTSGHTIEVIETIKRDRIPLILVENYFDPTVTTKIKQDVPAVRVSVVPVGVDGGPGMNTLDDVYENLVRQFEGK